MASVKIKFCPSTVDGGQDTVFYQVIHNRVARRQKTGYRLYAGEWNSHSSEVILPQSDGDRKTLSVSNKGAHKVRHPAVRQDYRGIGTGGNRLHG
jgi:integrase